MQCDPRTVKAYFRSDSVRRGVIAAALLLVLPGTALAQLNQNCTVSVLNRNTQVQPDGTWVLTNLPVNQGLVRARAVCTFSGLTQFGQSGLFTVPLNGSITLQPIIFGAVTPIPNSLLLTAATSNLSAVGATSQVTVTAQYLSGAPQNVTSSAVGTTYTSSNSAVATVSPDGLVTAAASGLALISAFNEGTSGSITLQVGIAPTVAITSPVSGASVVAGATIPVITTTTGTIAFVKFLVGGQVVFTSVTAPYQFNFTVPLSVSSVTFGAIADDGFGNTGSAQPVQIAVTPDPLTTVTGTVVDRSGVAIS